MAHDSTTKIVAKLLYFAKIGEFYEIDAEMKEIVKKRLYHRKKRFKFDKSLKNENKILVWRNR